MSFNGSGVFIVNSTGQPVVATTLIESSVFNAFTADVATGLSTCITKDGQTVVTANIPLGGFKLTGVGAATARTDAATLASIQDGTGVYVGTVGGTADVITLTVSPVITAYAAGQTFRFIASGANTTNVTVNVSALGAKAITKNGTTALVAGDIPSGSMVQISYDGTRFILGTTGAATVPSGAIPASVLTTIGDGIIATTAGAAARIAAQADVAAHATTSNIWGAREITLTGGAVTFTAIANAPYAGAVAWVKQNAAHVWTNGATFAVQGGANYTAASGDWIRVYANTVSTFAVTVFKASGLATVVSATGTITAGSTNTLGPSITTSTKTTAAHGLGATPGMLVHYLECTSADNSYAVGDRVYSTSQDGGSGTTAGYAAAADATNTYIITGSTAPCIPPNGGGTMVAIDVTKWKIVIVPYKVN